MRSYVVVGDPGPLVYPTSAWLTELAAEVHEEMRAAIAEGTAPATAWDYDLTMRAHRARCANSMDTVVVSDFDPRRPCPACRRRHPHSG